MTCSLYQNSRSQELRLLSILFARTHSFQDFAAFPVVRPGRVRLKLQDASACPLRDHSVRPPAMYTPLNPRTRYV